VITSPDLADMSASAVRRHRAAVIAAAERSTDATTMLVAASAALARVVPSAAGGWSVTDPAIILPTWPIYLENVDFNQGLGFWEREFSVDDRLLFRDLAVRDRPVGTLYVETSGLLNRSSRYRESISGLGFGDDLRAVLRVSGTAWGLVELVRKAGEDPFSAAEVAFIASLVEPLGAVLRARVMNAAIRTVPIPQTPGVMVLDADGGLVSSNDAAQSWLREMPNEPDGPYSLPSPIRAVLAYSHAVARGLQRGPARVRLRVRSGQWVVVDASTLHAADAAAASTVVVIASATSAEMASIMVSAYDLSQREQEVSRLLARGASTSGVAVELSLSVYTVRDHIKSLFAKVGVASRGELVARLFTGQYR
jgi:DNA-binding NarL/FixJ family response regulator